ncbi:MAG: hypothetical protein Q3997_00560 [Propionibacteriaceae bacterium]|nr:hypothetical protein [Propionibacteriaceae bacterium]
MSTPAGWPRPDQARNAQPGQPPSGSQPPLAGPHQQPPQAGVHQGSPGTAPHWAPAGAQQPPAWGQPQPGWNPPGQPAPDTSGSAGRDPYRPFNEPDLPRVYAEQFAPRRNRGFLGLVAAAVLLIGIVLFVATQGLPGSQPTPAPTRIRTAAPSFSPGSTGLGLPFESRDGSGYWQVDSSQWEGSTLRVTVTIRVDEGVLDYDLFAFGNAEAQLLKPEYTSSAEMLYPGTIRAGGSETGTVSFTIDPMPVTLVLADANSRKSISALRINP